jgi:hypothetical protein
MASELTDGVFGTKDYEINKLILFSSTGESIDLRAVFLEMQIFQDIFSSVMNGNIVISDGNDLFNSFSMCGNEYLQISIDKPSLKRPLEKTFRVYKVTDREPQRNSAHAQNYIIHFCSEEMILSNSTRISKAYQSKSPTDIITDVLLNDLKVLPKRIDRIEQTSGTYDFIVPYYRPLEVIQWAVARAYDVSPKFCYFFYESTTGYNFRSLQGLYQQKPLKKIKFEAKNIDAPEPTKNIDSIDKFRIINDFDVITSISNGSYASSLLAVDIFSQTHKNYNYSMQGAENNLLNKKKQLNSAVNVLGNTAFNSFNSYATTYLEINDTKSEKQNSVDKWMLPRALHMAAINSFRIEIVIPGDILYRAGDIVEIEFPKFVAPDETGKTMDEYRTCKYLVSAVNHKFTQEGFESVMELVTDSFGKDLPAPANLTRIASGN